MSWGTLGALGNLSILGASGASGDILVGALGHAVGTPAPLSDEEAWQAG